MKAISTFLSESTDEIIALCTVIPGMSVIAYLTYISAIQPEIILVPISMILVHYFRKSD